MGFELFTTLELPVRGDSRGLLVSIEDEPMLSMSIKRAYFIFETKEGVTRGNHAHKTLNQYMVCISGSCEVVFDDGRLVEKLRLDRPNQCVSIRPLVWHSMQDFTDDCILLVLADQHYDEADYLRNYNEFLDLVR